jgi:GNAT superfamily N-acetyltransferase
VSYECRELTPELWADVERLFGKNGAVGGCWCMSWRVEKGDSWDALKGPVAKRRFKALVTGGKAFGVLAYDQDEPIGWASYGPRRDYAKLDRAPSLACEDADEVWSVPCFFVKKEYRARGVAASLLAYAETAMRSRGARILEGYPVKPAKDGKPSPAAFAWTGTLSLFEARGFAAAGNRDGGKIRMRKALRGR